MAREAWSDEEIADLALPWGEFSRRHPARSAGAFLRAQYRYTDREDPPLVYEDRKRAMTPAEREVYFNKLIALAEEKRAADPEQVELTITLDSDHPIGIAGFGDWHIGALGTDYRTLKAHNRLLASTPGLYLIGLGDYIHNAKGNTVQSDNLYDSVFPSPDDQRQFALDELDLFQDKLIGLCTGCHENWDYQNAGIRTLRDVCARLDTANLWYGATVKVRVKDQEYTILARHKYGNGGANTTAAQRRADNEYPYDGKFDVIFLAHLHFNDMQQYVHRERPTIYFRAGSYYRWDNHGQKIGGYKGEPGVPMVILYPREKKMIPFYGPSINESVAILNYLRGGSHA